MKDEPEIGCAWLIGIAIIISLLFSIPGFRQRDNVYRTPAPTVYRTPTREYSGPSASSCEKIEEEDSEFADLCWDALEDYENERRMEEEDRWEREQYDHYDQYDEVEEEFYDPFE